MSGPTGFIAPKDRTKAQEAAHADAVNTQVQFALTPRQMAKGQSVRLFDFWSNTDVVAEVGFVFERLHQLSGSCVCVGGCNAAFSTVAAQRVADDNPTKAFLPFTWHNYAMSRHYYGEDGKGEGSMGSTFARSLKEDGIRDWAPGVDGMPTYTNTDGIRITKAEELEWSSYRNPKLKAILAVADDHKFGNATEARTTDAILALIQNGYGVTFACNNFVGNAKVTGSGDACVVGSWDTYGPHQQSIHAVWEHPTLGLLFWTQNSWPGETYPRDPAGGPECGCWVTEANVAKALKLDAEVYDLSNLEWFPARPKLMDWSDII